MHILCPHCQMTLDIAGDSTVQSMRCPSCGSQISTVDSNAPTIRTTGVRTLGQFVLIERVGRGHFGEVWRAHDTKLDRVVAVKIPYHSQLDEYGQLRLLQEAKAAAKLSHPNIVPVFEVGQVDETLFIVSDFIEGITLSEWLRSAERSPKEIGELVLKLCQAMHYAHEHGIIHRDLKPGNVIQGQDGQPHVLDFGLAKIETSEFTITTVGGILGTPAYMSPEQARGESGDADRRTDVYSLGVILYELLTGKAPFRGGARLMMYQILNEEPVPPRKNNRSIPRDLETICLKAMHKSPDSRYQTAQQMADELQRFLGGEPIVARRFGVIERSIRTVRRNLVVSTAVAIAMLATAAALGARMRYEPATPAVVTKIIQVPKVVEARQVVLDVMLRHLGPDGYLEPIRGEPSPERRAQRVEIVFWPLDPDQELPRFGEEVRIVGACPVKLELLPGDYLVVVVVDGHGFHEVYRHVPGPKELLPGGYSQDRFTIRSDGIVELPPVNVPPNSVVQGMAFFEGADRFQVGIAHHSAVPLHHRKVPAFWLDPTEFTVGDFLRYVPKLPSKLRGYETQPEMPMGVIDGDYAINIAEGYGKRLPNEFEYEFAATNGGTTKYPWGSEPPELTSWTPAPVKSRDFDRIDANVPVYGLYSNVLEWTDSWFPFYPRHLEIGASDLRTARNERIVRGGPRSALEGAADPEEVALGPRYRSSRVRPTWLHTLGIRLARSARPRLTREDFGRVQ